MSLKAYSAAQNATSDPRATEYRLFAEVTRALMAAGPKLDAAGHEALYWNRTLWSTLQKDLADPGNRLPDALKARLISLALWVDRYSLQVITGEAEVGPLIQVNRAIMEGLAFRSEEASVAADAPRGAMARA